MANNKPIGVAYADPLLDSVQVGTSNAPIEINTSGVLNGAYATTSATSGDTRLNFSRLTFTSTGSGETARFLTRVTGANGATAGTINGALRATIGGSSTNPGGTLAALQLDSDIASGGTWSNASFLRVTNSGSGTLGNFAALPAVAVDGVFRAKVGSPAVSHTIPVTSGGVTYYIMVSTIA